ncbi:tetratricopeptide repeat protein, partial [Streptomyces sparsus]
ERRVREATARLLALDRDRGAISAAPAAWRALGHPAAAVGAPDGYGQAHRPERDRYSGPGRGSRTGVRTARAELLSAAGWILFDAGRQHAAEHVNRRALALASEVSDRATARLVLATLSMQQAHRGRLAESGALAEAVLDSTGPLPPRTATVFRIRTARAHAEAGGRHRALAELRRARSLFLDGVGAADPPWTWWVDERELDGHCGLTWSALGDHERAADFLRRATDGPRGPAYRSLFAAELLDVLLRAGAWREAEQQAETLLDLTHRPGSARTVGVLRA